MSTADDYIARVLDRLPRSTPRREQIGTELRSHIAERTAAGQPLEAVLAQLGDPAALADSYLAEAPLLLPPHGRRIVAKIVDTVIVLTTMALVALAAFAAASVSDSRFIWIEVVWAVVFAGIAGSLYAVVAEWHFGQTVGKYLCGLWVVRESGARISFGQSIVRQLGVFLQVMWIDALFVLFTDKRQRAFELLSRTRTVALEAHEATEGMRRSPHEATE